MWKDNAKWKDFSFAGLATFNINVNFFPVTCYYNSLLDSAVKL